MNNKIRQVPHLCAITVVNCIKRGFNLSKKRLLVNCTAHHTQTDECWWNAQAKAQSLTPHTCTLRTLWVWVWEFSIPERLRCRLKRMSSHTEGSPHEIENHVACFQPDYRVGQSSAWLEGYSWERNTVLSLFKTGRLVCVVTVHWNNTY